MHGGAIYCKTIQASTIDADSLEKTRKLQVNRRIQQRKMVYIYNPWSTITHPTFKTREPAGMELFHPWIALKVWLILSSAMFTASSGSESCQSTCGDVKIPYPFGIGENCSLSDRFNLDCNNSNPDDPHLFHGNIEITSIELESSQVQALMIISYQCYDTSGVDKNNGRNGSVNLHGTPYCISSEENIFISVGCDTMAYIYEADRETYIGGCITWCSRWTKMVNGSCSGTSCCQTSIRQGIKNYSIEFDSWSNHSDVLDFNKCSYSFIARKDYYNFSTLDLRHMDPDQNSALVLDWVIEELTCEEAQRNVTHYACVAENSDCHDSSDGHGYVCKCLEGYKGNPYLQNGCQDIDECKERVVTCNGDCVNTKGSYTCTCPQGTTGNANKEGCIGKENGFSTWAKFALGIGFGLCLLFMIGSWIFWVLQKRKLKKLREDFFRQHGGLFLQEQISADEIKTFRIFTSLEIEKFTNKFNKQRVLGRGGNGIVYKGYLDDGTTVAIKKSLIVEAKKSKEFAKEMLILSNVNHVNIVKLLGCCLEVEVPMLVYEYVPNGTLSEQIHSSREEHPMPWDLRLKIGAESAKALSYLHSEASPPILHGDIKSSNILLGDNFVPKVSDFGSSTFTHTSKSRLMTLIQGTYGYLDPEYLRYGKLTDKSDVYSFGVVMAELLTRKKAIYIDEYVEKSLASEFECCMREGRLEDILDPQIIKDDNGGASSNSTMKELKEVANLVMQCLNYTGRKRPTITQVYVVLERLRRLQMNPRVQQNMEEVESLFTDSYFNTYEYQSSTSQLISTAEIEIANIGWINNQVDSSLQVKTL